ncbi:hypothetical protein V2I01_00520 [Micromonospora sp. BRA006-A]|nr:hypothetical protein [Micromonospora sp. BRA006-A]
MALFGRTVYPVLEATVRAAAMARTVAVVRLTGRVAVLDRWTWCRDVIMAARGDRGRRVVRAAYAVFPRPAVVCFLATSPEVARRRVAARGIDAEELAHLCALDGAYRALPEFGSFVTLDGDGTPDEVAAALDAVVDAVAGPAPRRGVKKGPSSTGGVKKGPFPSAAAQPARHRRAARSPGAARGGPARSARAAAGAAGRRPAPGSAR